ncbi:receptor-type tyrosine-protein phosphatase alpha-like [Saccostrea echinata]|uniref:receptor-type tyrosine-protein phosphatase alpha-like n=1 Tax=Saccostrea echinata TaxID=191078 RepID=UPI002A7F8605|nr:receptor-type tyrosine-protein phosphatase alpha-like [Saccostrea echinata]
MVVGVLGSLPIEIGSNQLKHPVYVAPLQVDMLLGIDLIQDDGIKLPCGAAEFRLMFSVLLAQMSDSVLCSGVHEGLMLACSQIPPVTDIMEEPEFVWNCFNLIRCYTDNTSFPAVPQSIQYITCNKFARFVRIETEYDAPEDEIRGAILEVCEIKVYEYMMDIAILVKTGFMEPNVKLLAHRTVSNVLVFKIRDTVPRDAKMVIMEIIVTINVEIATQGFVRDLPVIAKLAKPDILCNSRCNDHCISQRCNRDTGECDGGCKSRYYGQFCNMKIVYRANAVMTGLVWVNVKQTGPGLNVMGCKESYYGDTCDKNCSTCPSKCDRNTGKCEGSCQHGKFGEICDKTCSPACAQKCDKYSGICDNGCNGNTLGAMCNYSCSHGCIAKCGQYDGNCTCKEGWQGNTCDAENILYSSNVLIPIEDPEEEPHRENPEEAVYYNDLSIAKDIDVGNLLRLIMHMGANNNDGFLTEFKLIPYGERFDCKTGRMEENMYKNRFYSTFPYDHSRVILEINEEFNSDYINANFIENIDGEREYIASQGPRPNTVIDHWRMIWQEHVDYIVMLTNLREGPKVKCHQYWPDIDEELDISPFSVTLLEEKVYAYYIERKLSLRKRGVTVPRTVVQFQYTRWPDFGTPNPVNLVVFHRNFRHRIRPSKNPILVHCSAGIGRTGTFIAFDVLSRYGKDKGKVNVIKYVKAMRKDRMTMIQNVAQYVFLYHALYEFFRRKGILIKKDEFLRLYGDENIVKRKKQITDEFNELTTLRPQYNVHDFQSGKRNLTLNLTVSVLPVEQYLVHLKSDVPGREPYYNAVTVSSFTKAEEFISAQYPVPGAAIDLVRLIIDQKSPFLISLTPLSELNEESQKVDILECMSWKSGEILPGKTSTLTNLIKQLIFQRKSKPEGHITLISIDGAACCGVFLAVYNAIEQLHQDNEVDMFTIVQQLQYRRPEMISVMAEYQFCFKAVCEYLESDNVYANT